jgi:hypothetical protein
MRPFHLLPIVCCLPLFAWAEGENLDKVEEDSSQATPVPSVRLSLPEIPRTMSQDGRFTIYGGTSSQRSQVYHLADETQRNLLLALSMKNRKGVVKPEKGQLPIVIQLTDRFAADTDAVRGRVAIMPDESLSIQISLAVAGGWDHARFRDEMVRWFLVDLMLHRVRPEQLTAQTRLELPDWLHQGALELIRFYELGRPTELFASVFRLGKTLTIDEILNADITSLDAVSMNIYRVSSCAFIVMLLEQPDGVEHLLSCIYALPANKGTVAAHLEQFFPVLRGGPKQFEKWWSLALANYSEPTNSELLTMQQSETELARLLQITYRVMPPSSKPAASAGKKLLGLFKKSATETPSATAPIPAPTPVFETKPVAEFASLLKLPNRNELFQAQIMDLTRLSLRVHPFYRRVITEYQEQMAKLAAGKDRGVAEALAGLKKKRAVMHKEAQATEDYLDWYEATQRTHLSGKFSDYLDAARRLEMPPPRRTDPITRYLDAMEQEYK